MFYIYVPHTVFIVAWYVSIFCNWGYFVYCTTMFSTF